MLGNLNLNKLFWGAVFSLIPIYSWYRFLKTRKKLEKDLNATRLFYDRHNCVVMYAKNRGPEGWPNPNQIQLDHKLIRTDLYDSILYFINTATKSIDIAMMLVDTKCLTDALIEACKRKVVVRILLDYEYNKKNKIKELENAGAQVFFYVCPDSDICSILHYKYMIKDYDKGKGYVYVGSLNWTTSGIQENYENTVFTSNHHVAKDFHENFEEAWAFVSDMSKNNYFVKAKLVGIN